jgi:hypothetical protein
LPILITSFEKNPEMVARQALRLVVGAVAVAIAGVFTAALVLFLFLLAIS